MRRPVPARRRAVEPSAQARRFARSRLALVVLALVLATALTGCLRRAQSGPGTPEPRDPGTSVPSPTHS